MLPPTPHPRLLNAPKAERSYCDSGVWGCGVQGHAAQSHGNLGLPTEPNTASRDTPEVTLVFILLSYKLMSTLKPAHRCSSCMHNGRTQEEPSGPWWVDAQTLVHPDRAV